MKSLTYSWTDTKVCPTCIPGDGLYEPGEEGNLTASALAGNVRVDPNLFQPTSTQATAYVERQITEELGARVGFVYFTVRDQIETMQGYRPASAYTVPFSFTDPATGTPLTFYGIPNNLISACSGVVTPTAACPYPTTQIEMNTPENGRYKTVEASLNKRLSHGFSAGGGFGYTWSHDYPLTYPNTPNGPFNYDYTSANVKANGQYTLPWGVLLSAVYRFQLGSNYARTLSVSAPASCDCTFSAARGGSLSNTTVYATLYNAYRQDDISVFDLRGEKTLSFPRVKLRLFVDGFNLLNRYAAETITTTTGVNFQRPTAILAPRTARIGLRFIW